MAKALNGIYRPVKINYCIWGNIMPHIHCHLFPRNFEDDPGKPINQNEREVFLTMEEYMEIINKLRSELSS